MTILNNKKQFSIELKSTTIDFNPTFIDDKNITISTKSEIQNATVETAGEFEKNGVSIHAYKLIDAGGQKPDLLKIIAENCNILFVDAEINDLDKSQVDMIGEVNILIIDLDEASDYELKVKLAKLVEPQILLFSGQINHSKILEKFQTVETLKKLKITSADFDSEEYETKAYILE